MIPLPLLRCAIYRFFCPNDRWDLREAAIRADHRTDIRTRLTPCMVLAMIDRRVSAGKRTRCCTVGSYSYQVEYDNRAVACTAVLVKKII